MTAPADRPVILEEDGPAPGTERVEPLRVWEVADTAPINPPVTIPANGPDRARRPRRRRRGLLAFMAMLAGLLGLVGLAAVLWIVQLLEQQPVAGVLAAFLLSLLLLGVLGLTAGEIRALSRLSRVQEDRERLAAPGLDRVELGRTLKDLGHTLGRMPEMEPGVARWQESYRADHPPADMLALFDGLVLAGADRAALDVARRSVRLTFGLVAISPTALSDTVLFWFRALRLVRDIAESYGYRPTRATTLILAQRALKDAGLLAGVDFAADAVGHLVGGRMLERVSAAAAEGAVAAYRMGRFALLVMEACRPLPFLPERRPRLLDLLPRMPDQSGD